MLSVLHDLITSLRSVSSKFNGETKSELNELLHNTEKLPDKQIWLLASEALGLLTEVQAALEPGHHVLADHFLGYVRTKALCAAVELNIPDILECGPKSLSELATACNARADRLRQVLQTLYNNGIFSYDSTTGRYANNSTSILLQQNHWTQWRNWVDLYGNEFYDMARGIPSSCTHPTRNAAQINYDTDDTMFKYFNDQGWIPRFHKTLSGGAIAQAPGILEDYPWDKVANKTVIDIGGGGGGLIALLLRKFKTMQGAILEAPHVIEQARQNFHSKEGQYNDVADQIPLENLIAGDFFKEVPSAEVYTIKWCLHDWDDEKASTILRNIRAAIKEGPKSRLVILESVLKDGYAGKMSRFADMNMMVAVGGMERDEMQWRNLADSTGWQLREVYPLRNAWPSAIELVPAWPDREVVAEMRFLEPWDVSRGNPYIRTSPEPGYDRMNFAWQNYAVKLQDARPNKADFKIDVHGFGYFDDEIDLIDALRRNEDASAMQSYYHHVENFVKGITSADRIIIFDHTIRKRRPELSQTQNDDGREQPATMVHCDQTEKGALRRLKMNIGKNENIEDLLKNRIQMLNVWRPLNGPVQDWPLATMDYQTAKSSDMLPCDLLRGISEERGQTATFTHSDRQKWYYLDKQCPHEVTVIKIWDSNTNGTSKFCAHAAFNHPNAPPDAEPRESIEVRCLVISSNSH
ncbi:O-methyltransferase family 2 [Pyrenophora seminiperda CCB06]|uniref:O-methyltransferase family 2 n=1 Tax=Pyrenophora seminiperda CCB06 TaxID=1302712 RepID=A0A3M7LVF7_9PLEO|nr:O-methyltransferase family 2 [Pyrenophora seminiperda CCB06]